MPQLANLGPRKSTSPVTTHADKPNTTTYEGGHGFTRTRESELYVLGASYLFGQPTFYESADDRDKRFLTLVREADAEWLAGFVPYLRRELNIRTAAIVAAAEYVAAGKPHGRQVVRDTLTRADEPAEILGYWLARHGRRIPKPLKRGVADALQRLGTERNALKWAGWNNVVSMADAVQLTHPKPLTYAQNDLFKYMLARRRGVPGAAPTSDLLLAHNARAELLNLSVGERRSILVGEGEANASLQLADATWEWVASTLLPGGMDAKAWEAIIPQMGVMALLRNLRNFDQAGISQEAVSTVANKLASPGDVRASRVLPLRFLQAWEATTSMQWGPALEAGLEHSLDNVPHFPGKTVALADVSASMTGFGARSNQWQHAVAFATACVRASDDGQLVAYSNNATEIEAGAVLRTIDAVRQSPAFSGGTETVGAVVEANRRYQPDRIVVVTDEQAFRPGPLARHSRQGFRDLESISTPIYTWNVAGYKAGWIPSGSDNRHTVAGLSDAGFQFIKAIEAGKDAAWPWEK